MPHPLRLRSTIWLILVPSILLAMPIVSAAPLIVDNTTVELYGDVSYDWVEVKNNGSILIAAKNSTAWTGTLNITAAYNITVDSTSFINGTASGNDGGEGGVGGNWGSGGTPADDGTKGQNGTVSGGEGGFGGSSGSGSCPVSGGPGGIAGSVPGNETNKSIEMGSGSGGGGGGGGCFGGGCSSGSTGENGTRGGAGLALNAPEIYIQGSLYVNGGNGGKGGNGGNGPAAGAATAGGGGGGSGGGSAGIILIDGVIVNISNSSITATGGEGGLGGAGGTGGSGTCAGLNGTAGAQGAGGRIKIFYEVLYNTSATLNVSGGASGTTYQEVEDETPPLIDGLSPGNDTANSLNLVSFYVRATDRVSATSNCSLYVNGSITATNSSIVNDTQTELPDSLSEGNDQTWFMACRDGAGNENVSDTMTIHIDLTKPDKIVYESPTPANNSNISVNYVFINVSFNETNPYECRFDWTNSSAVENYTIETSTQNCSYNFTDQADGNVSIFVYVRDQASNINFSTRLNFTIDTAAPMVDFIDPTPANGSTLPSSTSSVTINVSVNETRPNTLILSWNGANETYNYSEPYTGIVKSVSAGTLYTYYVWTNDTFGNANTTPARSFSVSSPPSSGGSPSGGGGGGGGGGGSATVVNQTPQQQPCRDSWVCGDWSLCSEGRQARTCTYSGTCPAERVDASLKPAESRDCEEETATGAVEAVVEEAEEPDAPAVTGLIALNSFLMAGIAAVIALGGFAAYRLHGRRPAKLKTKTAEPKKAETQPSEPKMDIKNIVAEAKKMTMMLPQTREERMALQMGIARDLQDVQGSFTQQQIVDVLGKAYPKEMETSKDKVAKEISYWLSKEKSIAAAKQGAVKAYRFAE